MGSLDENSVRQQIIQSGVGQTVAFPIGRYNYVTSQAYRIGKQLRRRYTCHVTEDEITVTYVADVNNTGTAPVT